MDIFVRKAHHFTSKGLYKSLEPYGLLLWWTDALFWTSKSRAPMTSIMKEESLKRSW